MFIIRMVLGLIKKIIFMVFMAFLMPLIVIGGLVYYVVTNYI